MGKRIAALLGVALIVICLIMTVIFAVTGSEYFMGMLLLTMLIPVLLWVYLYFYKMMKDRSK